MQLMTNHENIWSKGSQNWRDKTFYNKSGISIFHSQYCMEQPDRRLRKEIEDLTINQPELTDTYPKKHSFKCTWDIF